MAVVYGPPRNLPRSISGLQIWLDASDNTTLFDNTTGGSIVTSDGAAIARWEDKSDNQRHITQSTAGSRPILKKSIQNRNDIIRFDGVDDILFRLDAFVYSAGASTIFCVIKATPTANTTLMTERSSITSNPNYIVLACGFSDSTKLRSYIRNDANTNVLDIQTPTLSAFDGTFQLIGKVDTGSNIALYINKTTNTNSNYTRSATTLDRFAVGGSRAATSSAFFACDLAEIIIYNRVLSSLDRQKIENYLYRKWKI